MKPKGAKTYTTNGGQERPDKTMNWSQSNPKICLDMHMVDVFMAARQIESYNILADLIGFHRSSMYRISVGKAVPNNTTLARMCAVLGCQPRDLLYMTYNFKDRYTHLTTVLKDGVG
jgi:DNA-binding Xre family transcriptional regulator|tara:strand:- start:560 stop:910 length:351 start_codon:yes stop_codon:yes gene_type:complete